MACALPWREVATTAGESIVVVVVVSNYLENGMEAGGEGMCLSLVWHAFLNPFSPSSPAPYHFPFQGILLPLHVVMIIVVVVVLPARSRHLAGSPVQGLSIRRHRT